MYKKILIIASVMLVTGCQTKDTLSLDSASFGKELPMEVSAFQNQTKISAMPKPGGMDFTWVKGDMIGVYIFGKQNNRMFRCANPASGIFDGTLLPGKTKNVNSSCRAYYPYSPQAAPEDGIISATLESIQSYPYDSMNDFIVSDVVTGYEYDERNLVPLSFAMNRHVFCIAKIQFTNTNEEMAGEKIKFVSLENLDEGGFLTGDYTINVADPLPQALFTDDPTRLNKSVSVDYTSESIIVGNGTPHTLYAIVRPCTIPSGKLKLCVYTDKNSLSATYDTEVVFNSSIIKVLPSLTLGGDAVQRRPTIVLWGDSISSASYLEQMKGQLEPEWKVIRCGVGGDNSIDIPVRQGANQMRALQSFTIPASASEKVSIRCTATRNIYGEEAQYTTLLSTWFSGTTMECANVNPVLIGDVECTISYSGGNFYIQRNTSAAEPLTVTAGTPILTYGQRAYRDCDLMILYMGTNGGHVVKNENGDVVVKKSDGTWDYSVNLDYSVLIQQYKDMIDYSTHHKAIVLGYHYDSKISRRVPTWCDDYVEQMSTAFSGPYTCANGEDGVATFMDLRTLGNQNFIRLMVESGFLPAGSTISDVSKEDKNNYLRGEWPTSFDEFYQSVHPNSYGDKAIAILVKEKIAEMKAAGLL